MTQAEYEAKLQSYRESLAEPAVKAAAIAKLNEEFYDTSGSPGKFKVILKNIKESAADIDDCN